MPNREQPVLQEIRTKLGLDENCNLQSDNSDGTSDLCIYGGDIRLLVRPGNRWVGWVIGCRYLIIDTRNWWPGKKVLVSPQWIERVSWDESKVFVNLPRKAIKQSPEYTEGSLLTRDYETGLHQHYDRQGYWLEEEPLVKEHSQ